MVGPTTTAMIRRRGPELAVAAVTAVITSWRVDVPSPWRDEGATWLAAGRPLADLLALTRTVDLVHLPYYLIAHAVLTVHDSIGALRWLSVAAATATAAVLTALGRRLGSTRVGVVAGLLLAVAPLTSRYGQEARPYALTALAASVATLCLARASAPEARRQAVPGRTVPGRTVPGRTWSGYPWVGYVAAVVATGLANVIALLVVAGHAVFVMTLRPRSRRPWTVSTAAATATLSPFLVATSRQADQVGWLTRPGPHELADVLATPFNGLALPGMMLVLALAAAVLRPTWTDRSALVLGAAWGLLPPLLLWLVSQAHPLFDGRYTVAALPGTCLALASPAGALAPRGRGGVRTLPAVVLVTALAVSGWPAQLRYRDPASGHSEDVRGATRTLTAQAQPGDAILFVPYHLRIVNLMAPAVSPGTTTAGVDDVALDRTALASATLTGTDVPPEQLPARLTGHIRVWLVSKPARTAGTANATDGMKIALLARDYVEVRHEQAAPFTVTLYERRPAHVTT
jgi:mannosyltransferase